MLHHKHVAVRPCDCVQATGSEITLVRTFQFARPSSLFCVCVCVCVILVYTGSSTASRTQMYGNQPSYDTTARSLALASQNIRLTFPNRIRTIYNLTPC